MILRMLLLADVHGRLSKVRSLAKVDRDITIVAGDLSSYGSLEELREVLRELTLQGGEVVWVPGNCDPPESLGMDFKGAYNIHAKAVKIGPLCFAGFGGSLYTPFNTLIEFSDEELREGLEGAVRECKGAPSVLVVHTPPYRSGLDRVKGGSYVGSRELRELMARYRPLLVATGHIHESWGVALVEGVLTVNPGPLAEGRYALVELDLEETVLRVVLRRVG